MTEIAQVTRVAVAQMRSGPDISANLASIASLVREAAAAGAQLVALPEYATYLGDNSRFAEVAEPIDRGLTISAVRGMAERHRIAIHVGSTVERGEDGRVYNTSVFIDDTGQILETYRKLHLFTSNIPGALGAESNFISFGDRVATTNWQDWTLGHSICFDLRFPELYRELARREANVLMIPAAFVAFNGKDHWEVLLRARAIENQSYVLAGAQIGKYPGGETYGRSSIVDPWGTVLAVVGDGDGTGIAIADLKRDRLNQVRHDLPALACRRFGEFSALEPHPAM